MASTPWNWWARKDLHLQGSQTLDLWGLLFPLNHSPKNWSPTRNCTELIRLPSECIAENALRAIELASLTGFAPVISEAGMLSGLHHRDRNGEGRRNRTFDLVHVKHPLC